MKVFIAIVVVVAGLFAAERFTREDRAASEARITAARQERLEKQAVAKLENAIKTKTPFEGMTYDEATKVVGPLSFRSKSDGAGGEVSIYWHNDGSFTTTLYFTSGRLARWNKTSNY